VFVGSRTSAPPSHTDHGIAANAAACRATGGLGIIIYNRRKGVPRGEVTKFLVYNARKRQAGAMPAAPVFRAQPDVSTGGRMARVQQLSARMWCTGSG